MPDEKDHIKENKSLTAELRLYVEKRVQLFSLTLAEQLSLMIAHSIQKLIGILLIGGAVYFLWFALGFYLGEVLDSLGLGFLLASIPLFIVGFVFIKHKSKSLTHSIQVDLIQKVMKSVEANLNINDEDEAESGKK